MYIVVQNHFSSFRRSCVPSLISVHHCSSIVDLWPCHTLTGVGSRSKIIIERGFFVPRHLHEKVSGGRDCAHVRIMGYLHVGRRFQVHSPGPLSLFMERGADSIEARPRALLLGDHHLFLEVRRCPWRRVSLFWRPCWSTFSGCSGSVDGCCAVNES